jgi:cephalosporin-C deacetylase-like acetyl esterase
MILREEAMRKDVEFKTQDGVTLRGWHYLPDQRSGKVPTIVMAHGFSAVKEMYLDKFADVFAAAGLGALVFDNRTFGASDGDPRQEIDPWEPCRLGERKSHSARFEPRVGVVR